MNLIETLLQTIAMKQDQILTILQEEKSPTQTKKVVDFKPEHLGVAQEMYDIINATTKTKKPNMEQWANDVRKLNEIDGADIHKIIEVFKIANKDDFWSMNVRSPKKLRKHWERLVLLRLKFKGLNSKKDTRESLDYFKGKQW